MLGRTRLASALLLTGFAGLGVAERVALHAHPLDESDLVPHQMALVERGEDCSERPHLDAGRLADHPVCAECALAAAAISLTPAAAVRLLDVAATQRHPQTAGFVSLAVFPRAAGARGPPRV